MATRLAKKRRELRKMAATNQSPGMTTTPALSDSPGEASKPPPSGKKPPVSPRNRPGLTKSNVTVHDKIWSDLKESFIQGERHSLQRRNGTWSDSSWDSQDTVIHNIPDSSIQSNGKMISGTDKVVCNPDTALIHNSPDGCEIRLTLNNNNNNKMDADNKKVAEITATTTTTISPSTNTINNQQFHCQQNQEAAPLVVNISLSKSSPPVHNVRAEVTRKALQRQTAYVDEEEQDDGYESPNSPQCDITTTTTMAATTTTATTTNSSDKNKMLCLNKQGTDLEKATTNMTLSLSVFKMADAQNSCNSDIESDDCTIQSIDKNSCDKHINTDDPTLPKSDVNKNNENTMGDITKYRCKIGKTGSLLNKYGSNKKRIGDPSKCLPVIKPKNSTENTPVITCDMAQINTINYTKQHGEIINNSGELSTEAGGLFKRTSNPGQNTDNQLRYANEQVVVDDCKSNEVKDNHINVIETKGFSDLNMQGGWLETNIDDCNDENANKKSECLEQTEMASRDNELFTDIRQSDQLPNTISYTTEKQQRTFGANPSEKESGIVDKENTVKRLNEVIQYASELRSDLSENLDANEESVVEQNDSGTDMSDREGSPEDVKDGTTKRVRFRVNSKNEDIVEHQENNNNNNTAYKQLFGADKTKKSSMRETKSSILSNTRSDVYNNDGRVVVKEVKVISCPIDNMNSDVISQANSASSSSKTAECNVLQDISQNDSSVIEDREVNENEAIKRDEIVTDSKPGFYHEEKVNKVPKISVNDNIDNDDYFGQGYINSAKTKQVLERVANLRLTGLAAKYVASPRMNRHIYNEFSRGKSRSPSPFSQGSDKSDSHNALNKLNPDGSHNVPNTNPLECSQSVKYGSETSKSSLQNRPYSEIYIDPRKILSDEGTSKPGAQNRPYSEIYIDPSKFLLDEGAQRPSSAHFLPSAPNQRVENNATSNQVYQPEIRNQGNDMNNRPQDTGNVMSNTSDPLRRSFTGPPKFASSADIFKMLDMGRRNSINYQNRTFPRS